MVTALLAFQALGCIWARMTCLPHEFVIWCIFKINGPWPMAKNSGPTSLFKKEIVVGVFLNWNGAVS